MMVKRSLGAALTRAAALLVASVAFDGCADTPGAAPPTRAATGTAVIEGGGNHVAIDLGDNHGCVLRSDGRVFCWGRNNRGQTAPGSSATTVPSLIAAPEVTLSGSALGAAEIAVGGDTSCVRRSSGTIACWGDNQWGIVTGAITTTPTLPTETTITIGGTARSARSLTLGYLHLCAVLDDASVACRGNNAYLQLGVTPSPTTGTFATVQKVGGGALTNAVKVVGGDFHTCALLADGQVFCWGQYAGLGATPVLATPVLSGAIDVAAGSSHTCALLVDHSIRCWGDNSSGQLGNNSTTASATPVAAQNAPASEFALSIAAGGRHTCAIFTNNHTHCWGDNGKGQSGLAAGVTSAPTITAAVNQGSSAMLGALTVAAGLEFTCVAALNSSANDGAVRCWGGGTYGELANGGTSNSNTAVTSFTPDYSCSLFLLWSSPHGGPLIDSGNDHVCALVETARCSDSTWERGVKCWGSNNHGQLGRGSTTPAFSLAPAVVTGLSADIISLSAGGDHTCVVTISGQVRCWGRNDSGQCGVSGGADVLTPTVVPTSAKAVQVTTGSNFTCALLGTGEVECWGSHALGTLGRTGIETDPTTPVPGSEFGTYTTPQRVRCGNCTDGNLTNVTQISAGSNAVCARLASGGVRCWGHNPVTANPSTRRTVSGEQTRIFGCGKDPRFCGCSNNPANWCPPVDSSGHPRSSIWNSNDILPHAGDVNANFEPMATPSGCTPRPVTEGLLAVSVSTHTDGACIVTVGGAVRCWGAATNGRLGDGTSSQAIHVPSVVSMFDRASGTALGNLTNAVAVSGGNETKCALRGDGSSWCWGDNALQQAGVNGGGDQTRAVDVLLSGGTTATGFIGVAVGDNQSCAMTTGAVRCWGSNSLGALGRTGSSSSSAFQVTF